ncbi:MAG TPA: LacI family DNA-binding transcriptional regulator [Opitutaceae bacterium]|jgi:LacI family transcriptional regulator
MILRPVTLRDVAKATDVHITTVSKALRDNPMISEATRGRIRAVSQRMGYKPSPFMRALMPYRGTSAPRLVVPTLAYVTNWLTRTGWKRVSAHLGFFRGAKARAGELGFGLEHLSLSGPNPGRRNLGETLAARGISGVIISSYSREMADELQLDWQNLSVVKIDYFPHRPPFNNVTNNQCEIARLALRRLRAAGYRRIGFVFHRGWDHWVDNNWMAGFLAEQRHAQMPIPAHVFPSLHPVGRWYHESDPLVQVEEAPFRRWLRQYRPDVLVSKGGYVLPVLKRMGLRIPGDIAFADLFLERFDGSMAGVRQNHEAVGAKAVEFLVGQLQHYKLGTPPIPAKTYVNGTWFDGASCPPVQAG